MFTDDDVIRCAACFAEYPTPRGIPALFPPDVAAAAAANNQVFDQLSDTYDVTLPSHVTRHYLRKRLRWFERIMPSASGDGWRVLDVGCGTGVLATALAARGHAVVGADVSLGMLDVMRRRGRAIPIGASGGALPFVADAFDLVVSVAVFHHIGDAAIIAATVAEMWRVVRPGGAVVIWDHNPANPYWPLLLKRMPQDEAVERLIPAAEIIEDFIAAGAPPDAVRCVPLGFTPDFAPGWTMPLVRKLETTVERSPLARRLAAHNVIIARKGGPR